MSVAAVLAIVVAVGEAQSSTSVALMAAAEESVGAPTTIRMVEVPAPSRASGLSVERQLGAGSVVVLAWREPARLHAVLLHHVVATDRWTIRRMSFAPDDALNERGRTLGLAVASMSPEIWRPAAPPPAASVGVRDRVPRPPTPAPPPAPTAIESRGRLTSPAETKRLPPPPVVAPVVSAQAREEVRKDVREDVRETLPEEVPGDPGRVEPEVPVARAAAARPVARGAPRAAPAAPRSRTFALGLAAIGAAGLGGPANGLGGMLEGVWFVRRRLALRIGLGLREGDVPDLPSGRDVAASAAVGIEWWVLGGARDEGWGVGVRLDALALHHRTTTSFAATPSAGPGVRARSENRSGADALVAAYLGLGQDLDLVAGAGLEVVDGPTDIGFYPLGDIADPLVATIPAFRAVGFAGLRVAW